MSTLTRVPFLDLAAVTAEIRPAIDTALAAVLDHGMFVAGPETELFENEFARFCGTRCCVGVANGTEALALILEGLGIGRGDEVILPTNTFVATAEAVAQAGATPRFVDVEPHTLLIDPLGAAGAVNHRTAAIVAVHLFGQPADTTALRAVADRHGLVLIEDAAQAHGARDGQRRTGSLGRAAAFSFYPGKNLGALGDGGAVVTDDVELAERIRALADHGRSRRDRARHEVAGRNSRLDTIQAAVLRVKLARLDFDNLRRGQVMDAYRRWLPPSVVPVSVREGVASVHHLAVVQVADRQKAGSILTDHQIGWGVHYPVPCHRQPAFRTAQALPVAERAAERILSLPMAPTMSEDHVRYVAAALASVES